MKKLLLTAFEPFGGDNKNASLMALERLPDRIGQWEIVKLTVPVVFGKAPEYVAAASKGLRPDAILCLGQAETRSEVTPELVGINLRHARIPDNEGNSPQQEIIVPEGPAAYFSTLPVFDMAEAIKATGLSGNISFSAGVFVCNDLLYSLLHEFHKEKLPIAFIHVPLTKEQAKEGQHSMDLDDIVKSVRIAIETI